MNSKSINSSDLKIEHLVTTSCKLLAQLKTCNEENIENLYIHYKQYLCKLYHLDQKLKTMSYGEKNETNLADAIQQC